MAGMALMFAIGFGSTVEDARAGRCPDQPGPLPRDRADALREQLLSVAVDDPATGAVVALGLANVPPTPESRARLIELCFMDDAFSNTAIVNSGKILDVHATLETFEAEFYDPDVSWNRRDSILMALSNSAGKHGIDHRHLVVKTDDMRSWALRNCGVTEADRAYRTLLMNSMVPGRISEKSRAAVRHVYETTPDAKERQAAAKLLGLD